MSCLGHCWAQAAGEIAVSGFVDGALGGALGGLGRGSGGAG